MLKILLVEDDNEIGWTVEDYLKKEGYVVDRVTDYRQADEQLYLFEYDVLLLDLNLPDGNGLDLLRQLQDNRTNTGVLIITAKDALEDRVTGLDLGADDYLTKPFHLAELNSRLKAIARRRQFGGFNEVRWENMIINLDTQEIHIGKKALDLTAKEYELLLFFIRNPRRVLTRQAIAEHLWGSHMDLADSFDFIYSHIKNLRKKLKEVDGEDYIKTVYGMGYKWGRG